MHRTPKLRTLATVCVVFLSPSLDRVCPRPHASALLTKSPDARPFLNTLSDVVKSGINVLIWAGDADWICNWMGVFDVANQISYAQTSTFANAPLVDYKVSGVAKGQYKVAGNLNFLRVYGAGHEVPYYRTFTPASFCNIAFGSIPLTLFCPEPQAALQAFTQIMQKKPLSST